MEIRIPAPAEEIINKLNEHGYEAYVVGGCVRDMLLGREPGDWDITTSALPEQVKEVFRRTVDTGIQHGTVTVMMGKEGYEVTTYRIDGEYSDGYELDAIAAVALGGTSMSGGRGKIYGTLIGVLIIAVLNNGLNILGVSSYYQDVIKGLVILIAVLSDRKR